MHAPKGILELINAEIRMFSEIQRVLGNIAFIAAAFRVALIKPAPILCSAFAVDFCAVKELKVAGF